MRNILWLTSWFPNRLNPLSGDFIERHAVAASLYNNIFVIHAVKDDENQDPNRIFIEKKTFNEHCRAEIIYYKTGFKKIKWLNILESNLWYFTHFARSIRSHMRKEGRPACIHAHIGLKAGLLALFAKALYKIPYIVSEQWTGLCPEAKPNIDEKGWLFRWLWKAVMRNSSS